METPDSAPIRQESTTTKERHIEIERKFLVKFLPENLDSYPHKEILQGYICVSEDGTAVRLREKGKKYYLTVKSGFGKDRPEDEIELTQGQFDAIWGTTETKRVRKTRYEIPDPAGIIELDIYHDALEGLVTVEVEFRDDASSDDFVPPEWFGEEVTDDESYKNHNLAIHGKPRSRPS